MRGERNGMAHWEDVEAVVKIEDHWAISVGIGFFLGKLYHGNALADHRC